MNDLDLMLTRSVFKFITCIYIKGSKMTLNITKIRVFRCWFKELGSLLEGIFNNYQL